MKSTVYKIITALLMLSILCAFSGCEQKTKIPPILFMYRTDNSDLYSPGEIDKNTRPHSLGFYDKDGNYYYSNDPDINAFDNKTLSAEYESGNLVNKIESGKNINSEDISEQYTKVQKICQKEKLEMDYPESFPDVEASNTSWYAFYYDKDGNLQYQTIHINKCMTDIYSKNSNVNDVYEWLTESFKNNAQSEGK